MLLTLPGCLADISYIKSLLMGKKVQRVCVVCAPVERRINKSMGTNKKLEESQLMNVNSVKSRCLEVCFELYHTYKDYVTKYVEESR